GRSRACRRPPTCRARRSISPCRWRSASGEGRGGAMLAPERRAWEHFAMRPGLKTALVLSALVCLAGAVRADDRTSFLAGETKNCAACDLAGLDLRGRDLKRAKLEGANLKGATLADASLFRAALARANLSTAKLAGTNFNLV